MSAAESPRLLLVDDDEVFRSVLARALERRGYQVITAHDVQSAVQAAENASPDCAVVDLKLPADSGLALVPKLKALNPAMRILILTGYASIATAVEAIKLGADHYLAKPADADQILAALCQADPDATVPVSETPLSVNRLEWEHIQRVLQEHDGNVSAAARALKMHRRTLQRKLSKKPARE